jgi:hypothetical protein
MDMGKLEAKESLLAALRASGALSAFKLDDQLGAAFFALEAPGQKHRVQFAVTPFSRADPALVETVVLRSRQTPWDRVVVVADRIPRDARNALVHADISWYDRRGHLRLTGQGIYVDATVEPDPRLAKPMPEGIRGKAGLAYAAAVLLSPDSPPSIRSVARDVGLSPAAVSIAAAAIRRAALVSDEGMPLVPDLFWALSDTWSPKFVRLGGDLHDYLQQGGERDVLGDERTPGWALTGDIAAVAWGAKFVIRSTAAPAFYVPDLHALKLAQRFLGDATHDAHSCSLAVAPTPLACSTRITTEGAAVTEFAHFLFAPPLFPALELADDPARGREILSEWNPSEGVRVW